MALIAALTRRAATRGDEHGGSWEEGKVVDGAPGRLRRRAGATTEEAAPRRGVGASIFWHVEGRGHITVAPVGAEGGTRPLSAFVTRRTPCRLRSSNFFAAVTNPATWINCRRRRGSLSHC